MSDSKNSYEQRSWELAVKAYENTKTTRDKTEFESVKEFCNNRMAEYEARYPQLKGK